MANSLDELAKKLNVPADNLKQTIAEYNKEMIHLVENFMVRK